MDWIKAISKPEYIALVEEELDRLRRKFWEDIQQQPNRNNRFERTKQLIEFQLLREQIEQWEQVFTNVKNLNGLV